MWIALAIAGLAVVGVVFVFNINKKLKQRDERIKLLEKFVDLADEKEKLMLERIEALLKESKEVATNTAEAVFKAKGGEVVSALVAEAMTREHRALSSFLERELEKLRTVQTARIDNVTMAVDDTSGVLTKILRILHIRPRGSNGRPASDASL